MSVVVTLQARMTQHLDRFLQNQLKAVVAGTAGTNVSGVSLSIRRGNNKHDPFQLVFTIAVPDASTMLITASRLSESMPSSRAASVLLGILVLVKPIIVEVVPGGSVQWGSPSLPPADSSSSGLSGSGGGGSGGGAVIGLSIAVAILALVIIWLWRRGKDVQVAHRVAQPVTRIHRCRSGSNTGLNTEITMTRTGLPIDSYNVDRGSPEGGLKFDTL